MLPCLPLTFRGAGCWAASRVWAGKAGRPTGAPFPCPGEEVWGWSPISGVGAWLLSCWVSWARGNGEGGLFCTSLGSPASPLTSPSLLPPPPLPSHNCDSGLTFPWGFRRPPNSPHSVPTGEGPLVQKGDGRVGGLDKCRLGAELCVKWDVQVPGPFLTQGLWDSEPGALRTPHTQRPPPATLLSWPLALLTPVPSPLDT